MIEMTEARAREIIKQQESNPWRAAVPEYREAAAFMAGMEAQKAARREAWLSHSCQSQDLCYPAEAVQKAFERGRAEGEKEATNESGH